jgi:hypothetical protein
VPEADLFLLFVRPLNRAAIGYMIGGSVAAIFYGEPRLTHDVDLIVTLDTKDVPTLATMFPDRDFYVPPLESIAEEVEREGGQFNLIHQATGFKADFYVTGRDELNHWGLGLKREIQFEGETVVLAPPEYVIVRKLQYFREGGSEKHIRDIRAILAVWGDKLDSGAIDDWIGRLDLVAEWKRVGAHS